MDTFRMAWRNVWRNKRRSVVTVSAMSLALLVMILYTSLVDGYIRQMERNLLDLELGEVQIFAEDYRDNPSIYKRIKDTQELLKKLKASGLSATARLLASGLAAGGDSSAGVSFIGVDVKQDRAVSLIYKNVMDGKWLDPADPGGVVIGRRLAKNLNVKPGDDLVVLSQGADGSMANELYKVRGILRGITESVDRTGVFMTADAFRDLMVVSEGTHQIIIRKPDEMPLNEALLKVREIAPGQDVKTWRQIVPTLASMMDSVQSVMFVMFMIVYFAIAIVILNAMLMAVFERIREFGIMKALGVGPGAVLRLILTEAAIQTLLAVFIGCALSIPGLWYLTEVGINLMSLGGITIHGLAWDPIWRASVSVQSYTGPVITLVVIVMLAVVYPAVKAAMIVPVRAIYHR